MSARFGGTSTEGSRSPAALVAQPWARLVAPVSPSVTADSLAPGLPRDVYEMTGKVPSFLLSRNPFMRLEAQKTFSEPVELVGRFVG